MGRGGRVGVGTSTGFWSKISTVWNDEIIV